MDNLKLYFCLISENQPNEITVHREMSTVANLWKSSKRDDTIGLIHTGYSRPNALFQKDFLNYTGMVIATAPAKWAIPMKYKTSEKNQGNLTISEQPIPFFLITDGFDYQTSIDEINIHKTSETSVVDEAIIRKAITSVLKKSERSLSLEEILTAIIRADLLNVVNSSALIEIEAELNRLSQNQNEQINSLLISNNSHFYFGSQKLELKEWVLNLSNSDKNMEALLRSHSIIDDKSYILNVNKVSRKESDRIGIFRYREKLNQIDNSNPIALLNIAPESLLDKSINSLRLSVRVSNVLKDKDMLTLRPLKEVSLETILGWKNFGKKSIKDMISCINEEINILDSSISGISENDGIEGDEINNYAESLTTSLSLIKHFEKALNKFKPNEKLVLECRLGMHDKVYTLEECGSKLDVTRERVRQIQKQCLKALRDKTKWANLISKKVESLLYRRNKPLILELIEVEDSWFSGFVNKYVLLSCLIESLTENKYNIIHIDGKNVVTKINQKQWNKCLKEIRQTLIKYSEKKTYSLLDVKLVIKSKLSTNNAPELASLAWMEFDNILEFNGKSDDSILVSYGASAESKIIAVLNSAEQPLHFTEVAIRATKLSGKIIDDRRAQNALQNNDAKLFGRGIYGLEKFNKVPKDIQDEIVLITEKMLYNGSLQKQWHTSELLISLEKERPNICVDVDQYLLSMILQKSRKISYLKRMVWARSDSNQTVYDRVDQADAFTKILENNNGPLKGSDLKLKLKSIRGVAQNLQIQPTENLIQIGSDYWGLVDRDIGGTDSCVKRCLDFLFKYLSIRDKGVHVSEVDSVFNKYEIDSQSITGYAILNLAQRDARFYLGRSMFLGLSSWGTDTKRLNYTQAVKQIMESSETPLKLKDINSQAEKLTGLPIEGTVTGILINVGAVYDEINRVWSLKPDIKS